MEEPQEIEYILDMTTYHSKRYVAEKIGMPLSTFVKLLNTKLKDILEEEGNYNPYQKCLYPIHLKIIDRETNYLRVFKSNTNFNKMP